MHRLHGDAGRTLFEQFPFDCGFRTFALADAGAAVYVDRLSDWRVALLAPGWSRVSFVWGDAATTDAGQQVIACARRHSPGQMMIISTPTTAWRDAIMAGAGPGAFVVPRVDYDAFDRDAFHAGALREPKVTFPIQPIDETWINHVRPDCDEHFEPITFRAQNGC
ncbi:MAG TPA: hypothetical protein VGB55_04640, partial [Tepidisphaeraceae bacterium]